MWPAFSPPTTSPSAWSARRATATTPPWGASCGWGGRTGDAAGITADRPSRLARHHQGVPTPAARDRAHPDHHFARGRYAAGAGGASVVADGLRGPPQGGGGQPNWVLQGPRDDGRILQGGGGRQSSKLPSTCN